MSFDDAPRPQSRDRVGDEVDAPEALESLACALLTHDGHDALARTLEMVVAGAVAALPAVERAGISLVARDGTVTSHAPSDRTVATLDTWQDEVAEGPCHDCIHHGTRVIVDDLAATGPDRWPRFAPVALEHQVGAMCSLQLFARNRRTAGALNLYAVEPGAFDASCLATASMIASQAALAMHAAQRLTDLACALESRDVIGQAKGILMERFGLGAEQAFERLRSSSQHTNLKLRDVATWLVTETTHATDSSGSALESGAPR